MAEASSRASKRTTLVVGKVEVQIGLFPAHAKPGRLVEFTTAGPNGGKLMAELRGRASAFGADDPPMPSGVSDPLADADPGPEMADPGSRYLGEMADRDCEDRGRAMDDQTAMAVTVGTTGPSTAGLPPATLGATAAEALERVDGEYGRVLVEEGTGELVEPDQVRRGVRLEDGRFIDCTDALARITEDTVLERIKVEHFMDASRIPRSWVTGTHYIGASDARAPKALKLLYTACRAERRAAVVKFTKKSRQYLGAIVAVGEALMLFELAWMEDLRDPPAAATRMHAVQVSDQELEMARALVTAMSREPAAIEAMRDDALALREALYANALQGIVPDVAPAPVAAEPDLVDALEASLAGLSA